MGVAFGGRGAQAGRSRERFLDRGYEAGAVGGHGWAASICTFRIGINGQGLVAKKAAAAWPREGSKQGEHPPPAR